MLDKIFTLEGFDHIASIASSIAIIITAIAGIVQWNRWQNEKRFECEVEVASRIMKVAYRSQLSLHYIQDTPFHASDEYPARLQLFNRGLKSIFTDNNTDVVEAQILLNRFDEIREFYMEISEVLPESKSLFGNEMKELLYNLSEFYNDFQRIIDTTIIRYSKEGVYDKEERNDKLESLNKNLDHTVSEIEKVVLPVIRYRSRSSQLIVKNSYIGLLIFFILLALLCLILVKFSF